MNKMIAMTAAAGLLLAAGTASAGITLTSTGGTNYPTIQAAVNQAAINPHNADTITLTAGTYQAIDVGGHPFVNLTIIGPTWTHGPGVYPPAELAGNGSNIVVDTHGTLGAGPVVTLSQLGITGGKIGLRVTDDAKITLDNCDVYNNLNNQDAFGAGLVQDSGSVILNRGYIGGNENPHALSYPGAYNTGGTIELQGNAQICSNNNDGITPLPVLQQVRDIAFITPESGVVVQCHANGLTDMNYDMVHSLEDVRLLRKNHHGLCHHDLNGNGDTDIDDLLLTIEGWGDSCTP